VNTGCADGPPAGPSAKPAPAPAPWNGADAGSPGAHPRVCGLSHLPEDAWTQRTSFRFSSLFEGSFVAGPAVEPARALELGEVGGAVVDSGCAK
jgi:hypothetical protein